MRLRKVKLAGFKSFVDPTTISLPGDLIAVVGPNGCGKSNVIDAVRWVMGEISAKHLRGDTMADVVFTGSNTRKPVGQASVELIFDNLDGRLGGRFASYNEISVKRQVTRESQSSYFLNGTRCRRRDVQDVFLGTGLGPRSYSIIEQGMISRLIEAKPDELREFLEEAAGISKYKERRRETENRIRHTRENLERLNDLREELEHRLAHLKRQAAQAERYRKYKESERELRLQLLALRWRGLDELASTHETQVAEQQTKLEGVLAEQRHCEADLERQRTEQTAASEAYNAAYRQVLEAGAEVARTEEAIESLKQRSTELQRNLEHDRQQLAESSGQAEAERKRLTELEAEIEANVPEVERTKAAAAAAHVEFREREEALHQWQSEWESLTQRASEPVQAVTAEETRIQSLEGRQEELASRMRQLAGEAAGLDTMALAGEVDRLGAEQSDHEGVVVAARSRVKEAQERIAGLRQRGEAHERELNSARERFQVLQGRLASLQALQEQALGKDDNVAGEWLRAHALDDAPRLAERVRVDSGWETAAEAVLGPWLEAVCVDRLDGIGDLESLTALASGRVGLVEQMAGGSAVGGSAVGGSAATGVAGRDWPALRDRVHLADAQADLALGPALAGVYTADSLAQALQRRRELSQYESFVTREGFMVGAGWCAVARGGERSGVLEREQALESLMHEHGELEQETAAFEQTLGSNRRELGEAEVVLDEARASVSAAVERLGTLEAELGARRAVVEQRLARAAQIEVERADLENRLAGERQLLDDARSKLERSSAEAERMKGEREAWHGRRQEHREQFEQARDKWQGERDRAYEIGLKVESARAQVQSIKAGIEREENRVSSLTTRCAELQEQLDGLASPLEEATTKLSDKLESRSQLDEGMRGLRTKAEEVEQGVRDLDEQRQRHEQNVSTERERLSALRLEGQETMVRRKTVEEQFADQILRAAQEEAAARAKQPQPTASADEEVNASSSEAPASSGEQPDGGQDRVAQVADAEIEDAAEPSLGEGIQVELSEPLTIAKVLAELPEEADEKAWEEELEKLEKRISRLGPINLAAIGEFEQQTERKTYLDAQNVDLEEALDTLTSAIAKMDRETRARFKETYEKVNDGIKEKFPRLFGGGEASLQLTGEDLLDTGVSVMARPPGKRNASIHLLSGGEKALAAVALVFAIFDLNPAPFCLLDEVDAPLDDSNVVRFCSLVKEMSERVQFIVITHNKITMEMTQQLIGVTMNEPGVSRLVAVDLDEAVELAAE